MQPSLAEMQQQVLQNPEMIQEMLNNPLLQGIMGDPAMLQNIMMSNPEMRRLIEQNPEVGQVNFIFFFFFSITNKQATFSHQHFIRCSTTRRS